MRRLLRPIFLMLILCHSAWASTETQTLLFPSAPAWYFVSLQLQPDADAPEQVFSAPGFAWDHLWSYDPVAGWSHASPVCSAQVVEPCLAPSEAAFLNDLQEVEALRGYWIHVTSVPSGGASVAVDGTFVAVQRLEGASWHAFGPLLRPTDPPANVATVFADLGPALASRVSSVWRFDAAMGVFKELNISGTCGSGDCLAPGEGYWMLSTGSVEIGQELLLSTDCLLLTPDRPFARLDIIFAGVASSTVAGQILLDASSLPSGLGESGLAFVPSIEQVIDAKRIPEPDPVSVPGVGPDQDSGLCPGICTTAECLDLCFSSVTGTPYTVFLGIENATFSRLEREPAAFTACGGRGTPYGQLDVMLDGALVDRIDVALRPPILRGLYAGSLFYDDGATSTAPLAGGGQATGTSGGTAGQVPLNLRLDDCILDATAPSLAYGPQNCLEAGRVVALANPRILGSSENARDDDGDGDVDELDEASKIIPVRDSPGFPSEAALYGTLSPDRDQLRLRAHMVTLPELGFAGSAGSPAADAGIAGLFVGASRELVLDGVRSGPSTIEGTFTERFDGVTTVGQSLVTSGRFLLTQVRRPQCIVKNASATEALAVDIACRNDADCPGYCTGSSAIEGFSCETNADCQGFEDATGAAIAPGTCAKYTCSLDGIPASSAGLFAHRLVDLTIKNGDATPLGQSVLVELLGPDSRVLSTSTDLSGDEIASLGQLACTGQPYTIRVSAPNCGVVETAFDPCAGTCSGGAASGTSCNAVSSQSACITGGGACLIDPLPLIQGASLQCAGSASSGNCMISPTGAECGGVLSDGGAVRLTASPTLTGINTGDAALFQLETVSTAPPDSCFGLCTGDLQTLCAVDPDCTTAGGTCQAVECASYTAAAPLMANASVELRATGGEPAVAGRGLLAEWTDLFAWSATRVRSGLLALLDGF